MSYSIQQKNTNILNRFESKLGGSNVTRFVIKTKSSIVNMIDPFGCDLKEATRIAQVKWGNDFVSIKQA